MEFKYKINSRLLILLMVGAIMTCSSYLMFVYQPLQMLIKKFTALTPGSMFFKLWTEPPYNVFIDVFIFNVTNPEEFLLGKEKLKLKEIGPYVYKETLKNTEGIFNENGTLTFQPRRYLEFKREMSVGDETVDNIISPNIVLLGLAASIQDKGFFANAGLNAAAALFNSPAFLNLTIAQYLWGREDQLVTYAHKILPSWINFERFGILDRMMALDNASNVVTLNVHPELGLASHLLTEKERTAPNHIQRWNGSPGLHHWGYIDSNKSVPTNSRCNLVEGAFEGTVFPPNMEQNSTLKLYRRAFCRPVPFTYKEKGFTKTGFEAVTFKLSESFLGTPEEYPDNSCYCVKGKCPPKGTAFITPCYYDIPITISQPHFLNVDPALTGQVEGMEPNEETHDSEFKIHPDLGVALEANLKIQINLDMGNTKVRRTKPFNGLMLPLFWLQLKVGEIPNDVNFLITLCYHTVPILQKILIYLFGLGGLAMMSGSALFALFFPKDEPNGRLSFRGEYSPVPIISINSPYFKPDLRIFK